VAPVARRAGDPDRGPEVVDVDGQGQEPHGTDHPDVSGRPVRVSAQEQDRQPAPVRGAQVADRGLPLGPQVSMSAQQGVAPAGAPESSTA
jgi:hypothetical protein